LITLCFATEVPNWFGIEPITFYPYAVEQNNLDKGFSIFEYKIPEVFEVFFSY